MSVPSASKPSSGKGWLILIGVLIAAAAVAAVVIPRLAQRNPGDAGAALSADDCRRLEALKNLGVGYLENNSHAEAAARFAELSESFPNDPLGPRNLVIARLLALQTKSGDASAAQAAVPAMLKLEPDSPAAHLLAARVMLSVQDSAAALAELQKALDLSPEDPALWFEKYMSTKDSQDPAIKAQAVQALERAGELSPGNVAILVETLRLQSQAKDTAIGSTLERVRDVVARIPGIAEGVRQQTQGRVNVTDLVDSSLKAFETNGAAPQAPVIANLINAQAACKSDRIRMTRHSLEFVLHDFQNELCAAVRNADEAAPANVAFRKLNGPDGLSDAEIRDAAVADFDLDGTADIIVLQKAAVNVQGRPNVQRRPAGNTSWSTIASLPLKADYQGLVIADLDGDDPLSRQHATPAASGAPPQGAAAPPPDANEKSKVCREVDVDLIAYGPAGALILKNELDDSTGGRSLVAVSPEALQGIEQVSALIVVDFDHDGDLDLVLSANERLFLLANFGNLTFKDVSEHSELPPQGRAANLLALDWDRDVDADIVVALPGTSGGGLLENLRHGRFRWRAFEAKEQPLRAMSALAVLGANAEGSWDLASSGGTELTLASAQPASGGRLKFEKVATLPKDHRGLDIWDFDNDGHTDLIAWSATSAQVWQAKRERGFTAAPNLLKGPFHQLRACRIGDLDNDGDLDLVLASADGLALYDNEGGNRNHWLNLSLRAGTPPQELMDRVNHLGIGSLIEVKAGTHYQSQLVRGQVTHFGLGMRKKADVVRVLWTNGIPQNLLQVQGNTDICEEQKLGGSCPYLYTWNGKEFEFCTDCLWNAPLGLQLAENVFAPSRDWEYLRIPGTKLKQHNGRYQLQVTEELSEAAYLDRAELIAVDHPVGVSVYSNEKVGPAEIARFKVHTAARPRRPVAARDHRGRDVLAKIAQADGNYLKGFDRKICQGLTEDHYLELDLGELQGSRQITLFLTGWIYPTNSSLNVALSQDAMRDSPRPPSLWAPGPDGQWQEIMPFMGFPGGKTKTIAVDLSQAFPANDYRLRIATNMEIYWDEAFFTVDEEPAPVELSHLKLERANLHYRGFSRRTPDDRFGPEHFDYGQVSTAPQWPPMQGSFTRYGDVGDLLAQHDDRLVIFGAGDELSLEFGAPDREPPAGWTRDFLLYNVGWDKDCDLNTAFGQAVEPLPFAKMSGYPYAGDEEYPAGTTMQDYLQRYQTRVQCPARFWQHIRRFAPEEN